MKMTINVFLALVIASMAFTAEAQTVKPNRVIPVAEYYPGGQDSLYAFINKKIIYPITAKRNRMQGECVISFNLTSDGRVENVSIVKNVGGGTGEEAARIVKLLKFKGPGFAKNFSLPIIYKL
ncbi:MAG TPA: energy transducer TonB [Cytophagaceae bacterium]|jgi:protein TonB|nr:energy transducer TonB [Cytophagaceae bacterium]